MKRAIAAICLLSCAVLLAEQASGHDHATGVVKERMDAMESMQKRLKVINRHLKDARDLPAVKANADAISEVAAHIAHQFPPGSTQPPTRARKSLWHDFQNFEKQAAALKAASEKLSTTSPADLADLRAQARVLSDACDACHDKYRTGR